MIYLRATRKVPGSNASAIPLYLPPDESISDPGFDKNVFFGAISLYLREKVPFLKNMPLFFDKLLDSAPMLRMAAKRAGTTSSEGLEDMTINMITGQNAFPDIELQRLVDYINKDGRPDILHLSNALIIGLARQLKKKMDVIIVCSLLNEDDWLDDMAEPYRSNSWKLIAKEASNVDAFVTPSNYYKQLFIDKTGISGENIHVIPLGIEPGNLTTLKKTIKTPGLGYFCRLNSHNGFDKIVDAFIEIRKQDAIPGLTFHVSGGYTGVDKAFIREQIKKIKENGLRDSVRIYPEFHGYSKERFFSSIDIMSVPVRKYDGYGLYILEANAAGVPVVQPDTGAFPEIIHSSGGGIVYSPDSVNKLTESIINLFNNNDLRRKLGNNGRENIQKFFTLDRMAEGLSDVYSSVIRKK